MHNVLDTEKFKDTDNLDMTKGMKIIEIMEQLKIMLMIFVAIMAFVMTSRSWFISVQYVGIFILVMLIWMVDDFHKLGQRLRDLGISISNVEEDDEE